MNHESKIIDMLSRIVELLLLNLLFVLTSLPLVTIGASLTALFAVNLKLVKNEESYIVKEYFRAFRKNFGKATVSFLVFVLFGSLFAFNIILALRSTQGLFLMVGILSLIFLILLGVYALFYFPLLAKLQLTHKEALGYISGMIGNKPGVFLGLVGLNLPVIFLCVYSVYTLIFVLIVTLVIGAAGFTYVEAGILGAGKF